MAGIDEILVMAAEVPNRTMRASQAYARFCWALGSGGLGHSGRSGRNIAAAAARWAEMARDERAVVIAEMVAGMADGQVGDGANTL